MVQRIDAITAILNTFGRPLAILSLTIIALAWIFSPGAQEWMAEHRGVTMRVVAGLIIFPAITTIVALFI